MGPGRSVVGRVRYAPELHCEPHCYTGLQLDSAGTQARRGARGGAGRGDAAET